MEDNTNNINGGSPAEDVTERRHYTRQQSALYTVISIALFFALYFGGKSVIGLINRSYTIYLYPENITGEASRMMFEISGLSDENGLFVESARLSKYADGHTASVLFSGFDSEEDFVRDCILFEYGDPVEDLRIEFFPYDPAYAEYAFGTRYVDIDDPDRSVSVFEFEDTLYALYTESGGTVPTEIKAAFSDGEKVY